jgi:hypothetical protein
MFRIPGIYGLVLFAAVLIQGCTPAMDTSDVVIAEVRSKKLYLSEVSAVIPNNLDPRDSMIMADDYVRKWIRHELVLRKAEENLPADLKNVTRELEEYRNSLIIFRYKNELMAQRMDTTVSNAELMEYYTQHADNFKLGRNIVKAVFLKIPAEFANPEVLKKMASETSEEGTNEIRDFGLQYARGFDVFTDRWIDLDRVMNNIPMTIENAEQFLQNNRFIEYSDSSYYYLVAIHDYLLKNEQAPEEYVRNNIKSLILNRRKIEFLREVENNIYQEGINRNIFKIYNPESNEAK